MLTMLLSPSYLGNALLFAKIFKDHIISYFCDSFVLRLLWFEGNSFPKSGNHTFHEHTEHLEINYHFICDKILKGVIKTSLVPSSKQVAINFPSASMTNLMTSCAPSLASLIDLPKQEGECCDMAKLNLFIVRSIFIFSFLPISRSLLIYLWHGIQGRFSKEMMQGFLFI